MSAYLWLHRYKTTNIDEDRLEREGTGYQIKTVTATTEMMCQSMGDVNQAQKALEKVPGSLPVEMVRLYECKSHGFRAKRE